MQNPFGKEVVWKSEPIETNYDLFWDQRLGTGINGDVVKCRKKETGEFFALKCLRPRPEAFREVNLHFKCCNHKNIVNVYEVYDNVTTRGPKDTEAPSRKILLIMELMEGGELFDRILKKKTFTEKEASAVLYQMTSAVNHIHSLNIAHRDLKPENLLYQSKDEDSLLKLVDFGFAKIDQGNLVTPVYTPYYVSGEILKAQQVQKDKKAGVLPPNHQFAYDKSCDMWSLGVILYIILCGYPPFQSEIRNKPLSEKMKSKIRHGDYVFHDKYWKNISTEAKNVVSSLLCTQPAERAKACDLLKHAWVVGENVSTTPLETPGAMQNSAEERAIASQQFEQHLTVMRNRNPIKLKPLNICANRIKEKRMERVQKNANANQQQNTAVTETATTVTSTTTATNTNTNIPTAPVTTTTTTTSTITTATEDKFESASNSPAKNEVDVNLNIETLKVDNNDDVDNDLERMVTAPTEFYAEV